MNHKYTIPAALIGVSIALVQPQIARAICSNDQVDTIGKEITVLIDSESPGSGVIIKQTGNTYTVITAYHVVKNSNLKYQIVTPDNQRYQLNYQTVKRLDNNIDLAILQFTSKKDYQVAKIGNSDEVKRLINVHVAGFPRQTGGVRKSIYDCRSGRVIDNLPENIDSGYNLFYDNPTLGGMSGGAVLNDQGEVVAIHGQGEESNDVDIDRINSSVAIVKSGRNSGIPINTFLRLSARNGVDFAYTPPRPQTQLRSVPKQPKLIVSNKYTKLQNLLAVGKWQKADEETARVMLAVAKREEEGWLDEESINNFPCEDLRTIDQLWVESSNGRFGFSVQKQIYQSLGGTTEYNSRIWQTFGDRVGWRKGGEWLHYKYIIFSTLAPKAHLPSGGTGSFIYEMAFKSGRYWVDGGIFFSHVDTCQL